MAVDTTSDAGLLALMNQGKSQDGFGMNSVLAIADEKDTLMYSLNS